MPVRLAVWSYPPSAGGCDGNDPGGARRERRWRIVLSAGWLCAVRDCHLNVPKDIRVARRVVSAPSRLARIERRHGAVVYARPSTPEAERAPAAVTLDGDRASVRGLGFFWPENNPAATEGLVAYPFAIRGRGTQTAVVDVSFANAWNRIDFASQRNDPLPDSERSLARSRVAPSKSAPARAGVSREQGSSSLCDAGWLRAAGVCR